MTKKNPSLQGKMKGDPFTVVCKEKFLSYLESTGGNISAACRLSDMTPPHRPTVYVWRNSDPVFRKQMDEVRTSRIQAVEDTMYSLAVMKNDFKAAKYILDHRHPDYKTKKSEFHIHHHSKKPIPPKKEPSLVDIIAEDTAREES